MSAQAHSIVSDQLPGISEEALERVRAPLDQAATLPVAAYSSDEIYALELERVQRRSWHPLARIDQVPEPGDYLTIDLLGQPVMVVHGTDGEIRVLANVCLHRAAPVAQGCGSKHLFTCPYHAWSYDSTGQLKRAPLMDGAQDFAEQDLRLPQIRSELWHGFVMATLDENAPAFSPQVQDFADYFAAYRLQDMVTVKTLEYHSGWNWKVLVENFMEAYHHIAIHSKSLEPGFHARDSVVPDNTGPWSILHMPAASEEVHAELPLVEGLSEPQQRDLYANVIFPHFMIAIQGTGAFWYQVIPGEVDQFLLRVHVLLPRDTTALPGFDEIAEAVGSAVDAVHQEDIFANDQVWRGLTAPLTEQGRLSPLEKSIWQMNQWWLDQMTAA